VGQLEGKRIIVTGGSQGIGEGTVRAYVAEGATVCSMDIQDALGKKVAEEANQKGPGSARYYHCDVTKRGDVEPVFAEAIKAMGGLDVMADIAGVHKSVPSADITDELYEWHFKTHVLGTILTNQVAFKSMCDAGAGNIINFGSEAGLTAEIGNALYGAAKGAIHTWVRSVAREWGPYGIRVNAVLPYVATPMYYAYLDSMSPEELAEWKEGEKKGIPLRGKFGTVMEDLAPFMVFLASDASHYITGQLFCVDGGAYSVR